MVTAATGLKANTRDKDSTIKYMEGAGPQRSVIALLCALSLNVFNGRNGIIIAAAVTLDAEWVAVGDMPVLSRGKTVVWIHMCRAFGRKTV